MIETDYALVILEKTVSLDIGYLGLISEQDFEQSYIEQYDINEKRAPVIIAGFNKTNQFFFTNDYLADIFPNSFVSNALLIPGVLGCPVIVRDVDYGFVLIGIMKPEGNGRFSKGCLINNTKFCQIVDWMKGNELSRQKLQIPIHQYYIGQKNILDSQEVKISQKGVGKILRINNRLLAACCNDKTIKIYNYHNYQLQRIQPLEGICRDLTISHDSPYIYCAVDNDIITIHWEQEEIISKIKLETSVFSVHKLDSNNIIAGDFKGNIYIIESFVEKNKLEVKNMIQCKDFYSDGHSKFIQCFCFISPTIIASGGGDGLIKIWDWTQPRLLKTLEGHNKQKSVYELCFDQNSQYLISCGSDHKLLIWDIIKNMIVYKLEQPNKILSISQLNNLELGLVENNNCYILNLKTYHLSKLPQKHSNVIRQIQIVDAQTFVTSDEGGTMYVWSVKPNFDELLLSNFNSVEISLQQMSNEKKSVSNTKTNGGQYNNMNSDSNNKKNNVKEISEFLLSENIELKQKVDDLQDKLITKSAQIELNNDDFDNIKEIEKWKSKYEALQIEFQQYEYKMLRKMEKDVQKLEQKQVQEQEEIKKKFQQEEARLNDLHQENYNNLKSQQEQALIKEKELNMVQQQQISQNYSVQLENIKNLQREEVIKVKDVHAIELEQIQKQIQNQMATFKETQNQQKQQIENLNQESQKLQNQIQQKQQEINELQEKEKARVKNFVDQIQQQSEKEKAMLNENEQLKIKISLLVNQKDANFDEDQFKQFYDLMQLKEKQIQLIQNNSQVEYNKLNYQIQFYQEQIKRLEELIVTKDIQVESLQQEAKIYQCQQTQKLELEKILACSSDDYKFNQQKQVQVPPDQISQANKFLQQQQNKKYLDDIINKRKHVIMNNYMNAPQNQKKNSSNDLFNETDQRKQNLSKMIHGMLLKSSEFEISNFGNHQKQNSLTSNCCNNNNNNLNQYSNKASTCQNNNQCSHNRYQNTGQHHRVNTQSSYTQNNFSDENVNPYELNDSRIFTESCHQYSQHQQNKQSKRSRSSNASPLMKVNFNQSNLCSKNNFTQTRNSKSSIDKKKKSTTTTSSFKKKQ